MKSWARRTTVVKPWSKPNNYMPDLIVMDHTMPMLNGLEATRQIRQRSPEIQVLILTMHTNEEYVFQFLQAGAAGYLIKESAPNELVAAIRCHSSR